jgi:hypothetical protein
LSKGRADHRLPYKNLVQIACSAKSEFEQSVCIDAYRGFSKCTHSLFISTLAEETEQDRHESAARNITESASQNRKRLYRRAIDFNRSCLREHRTALFHADTNYA